TGVWLTTALFRLLVEHHIEAFAGLRQVLTGGEVARAEDFRRLLRGYPQLRITHAYGPTENTTFTTVYTIDSLADITDPLPLGGPIAGTGVVVLDADGRLLPPGAVGELYTSGRGLAVDYAGQPDATAAAFGRFSPDTPEQLYRTGDLVRWTTGDGCCSWAVPTTR